MKKVKEWCGEHKKELIVGAIGVVGGVLVGKYLFGIGSEDARTLNFVKSCILSDESNSFLADLIAASKGADHMNVMWPANGPDTVENASEKLKDICAEWGTKSICGLVVFGQKDIK